MHITNYRQYFLDTLVELTGIKSGLAVSVPKAVTLLDTGRPTSEAWWRGDPREPIRLEGGVVQSGFVRLLHRVGAIQDPKDGKILLFEFVRKHADRLRPDEDEDFADIMTPEQAAVGDLENILHAHLIGTTPLIRHLVALPEWNKLLKECALRSITHSMPASKEWDGTIKLDDLFQSEEAPADPETYFDQRFIDYLHVQTGDLTEMHWRQFEYLVAEYYRRCGYQVHIGPGRDDGGVDVRLEKERVFAGPEVILIQCKRRGEKYEVKIDEVKALWADVLDEGAAGGLIATTTRLAKGAREYCDARQHRLTRAEAANVVQWLRAMTRHQQ